MCSPLLSDGGPPGRQPSGRVADVAACATRPPGRPARGQDEILAINTDARHLALQVALLVTLLASLVGVVNAFRMVRLPEPEPTAAVEGAVLG